MFFKFEGLLAVNRMAFSFCEMPLFHPCTFAICEILGWSFLWMFCRFYSTASLAFVAAFETSAAGLTLLLWIICLFSFRCFQYCLYVFGVLQLYCDGSWCEFLITYLPWDLACRTWTFISFISSKILCQGHLGGLIWLSIRLQLRSWSCGL